MIRIILLIGSGSFLGGVARFLASRFIHSTVNTGFPVGTFIVNIVGCFLIGLVYGLSERGELISLEYRMFLTAGFCGGFTTFSAFSNENLGMIKDGNIFHLALYVSASVFLGILATYLGHLVVKTV